MNLSKKKELASKVLGVGKNKIYFSPESLSDIKEAITKQDILSLHQEGIIMIKPKRGRKKVVKRRTKRGPGKIKFKVRHRKRDYMNLTRKLRKYLMALRDNGTVSRENYYNARRKIRMKTFKNMSYFKDYLKSVGEINVKDNKTKKTAQQKQKTERKKQGSKK
jgi:large subunit ribosomal protein L19e